MKKFVLLISLVCALSMAAFTANANAVTYNTGWVCNYLDHPAPVPYANGYLFCFSNYRWWFVGP